MLTIHTIFTRNSRYEALTAGGHVLAVRQTPGGTYLTGVTEHGWLPLASRTTVPAVGETFEFVPIGVQTVTTSRVQFIDVCEADVYSARFVHAIPARPRVALTTG